MSLEWEALEPDRWRAKVVNRDYLHLEIRPNGSWRLTASWLQSPLRTGGPEELPRILKAAEEKADWHRSGTATQEGAISLARHTARVEGLPEYVRQPGEGLLMGYFSNGTEGELYREAWCYGCRNWRDEGDGRGPGCPVMDAHFLYAYGARDDAKSILDLLIPREGRPQRALHDVPAHRRTRRGGRRSVRALAAISRREPTMTMNPVNYEEAGIAPPQEDAWSTDPYFSAICAVVNAAEKVHEGTMKNGHPYELFAVRSPQEGGKRTKDYTTFSRAHVEYIRHLLARTDGRVLLYMRVHNTFKPWTGDDGVERYSKNMRLLHLDGWATVGTVEPFENVITEPQAHAKDAEKYDMFGNPPLTAIIYAPPGTDGPVTLSPEELQNQMNARPTGAKEPAVTAPEAPTGGPGPSWGLEGGVGDARHPAGGL